VATNPSTLPENSGRITAPDANYPYGSAKDDSTGTTGDGTPIKKALLNDTYGFYQWLLTKAGIVPSGTADTAIASDLGDALGVLFVDDDDLAQYGIPTAAPINNLNAKRTYGTFSYVAGATGAPDAAAGGLGSVVVSDGTSAIMNVTDEEGESWTRTCDGAAWSSWSGQVKLITKNTTFYFSPAGNDNTGDGTQANPWFHLQPFVDTVKSTSVASNVSVTLEFDAGTYFYNEPFEYDFSFDLNFKSPNGAVSWSFTGAAIPADGGAFHITSPCLFTGATTDFSVLNSPSVGLRSPDILVNNSATLQIRNSSSNSINGGSIDARGGQILFGVSGGSHIRTAVGTSLFQGLFVSQGAAASQFADIQSGTLYFSSGTSDANSQVISVTKGGEVRGLATVSNATTFQVDGDSTATPDFEGVQGSWLTN